MTPAGELLRDEIRRGGPVSFRRFMEVALYHPECGYYRRPRDPFGKDGDFYTAEQMQPVFGILMAALVRRWFVEMGEPRDFTIVEPGAGREEMASAFREWRYVPVEAGHGEMPKHFRGVVFCNEFFDALPVEVAVFRAGTYREQRVAWDRGRFAWVDGGAVRDELEDYFRRYFPPAEDGIVYEANLEALVWLRRAAASLDEGRLLSIDYGYCREEWVRFPGGTLMGYRRHTAREDVLASPGERDITAHVNFSALEERGAACGLVTESLQTLAQTLLAAGEADRFRSALGGEGMNGPELLRRRMQLKSLLFGMGETFRTLLLKKAGK